MRSDSGFLRHLAFICLIGLLAPRASAAPVTLTLTGTVSLNGVPLEFVGSPIAVGDPFSAVLTFDPLAALTGPDPNVDTYQDAVLEIAATFHTSSGTITYRASGPESATTVNFAAVRSNDVFFQITDNDLSGALGSVTGPSIAGIANGQPTVFVPNFLAVDFMGDFSGSLTDDVLPFDLLAESTMIRLMVGTWGPVRSGFHQANYEAIVTLAPVPEPGTLSLLGLGIFGTAFARRRRTAWKAIYVPALPARRGTSARPPRASQARPAS